MDKNKREERDEEDRQTEASGESLEDREYRDAEGNVHHHTKKYMEDHREDERE